MSKLLGFLFLCIVFGTAQAGSVYKWVDEQGNTHYSQEPHGSSAKEMNIKTNPATSSTTSEEMDELQKQVEEIDKSKQEQAKKDEKTAIEQKNKEIRAKNCSNAKSRYNTLNAGGRLYEVDEKGERFYLDDSMRQSRLAEAQKAIDEWCSAE